MNFERARSLFIVAFAFAGMFFWTGSSVALLSTPGEASSAGVQLLAALFGLVSSILLLFIPHAIPQILSRYWLPLLSLAFAAVSILWSVEASLSVRRVIALSLTSAFGYWIALRFSGRDVVRIVHGVVVVSVLLNFLVVFANPTMGIHQANDIAAGHHYGSWRGVFAHKNDFGRFIAFCICVLVLGMFERLDVARWRSVSIFLILLCLVMIVKSNSSQAVFLGVVIPAAYLFVRLTKTFSPTLRALSVTIAIPAGVVILSLGPIIFEMTLLALGRDTTLTGRTEIWLGTINALGANMPLGLGFGAGWELVGERLYVQSGVLLGHAHNGYLDLVVDIGVLGTGLALILIFAMLYQGFMLLMLNRETEIASLAINVALFIIVGNWAGSFLMLHNSIHWVLPIACYVVLARARRQRPGMARRRHATVGHPAQ